MKIRFFNMLFFCCCMCSTEITNIVKARFEKKEFCDKGSPDYFVHITLSFENNKIFYYWREINTLDQNNKKKDICYNYRSFSELQKICDSSAEEIFDLDHIHTENVYLHVRIIDGFTNTNSYQPYDLDANFINNIHRKVNGLTKYMLFVVPYNNCNGFIDLNLLEFLNQEYEPSKDIIKRKANHYHISNLCNSTFKYMSISSEEISDSFFIDSFKVFGEDYFRLLVDQHTLLFLQQNFIPPLLRYFNKYKLVSLCRKMNITIRKRSVDIRRQEFIE